MESTMIIVDDVEMNREILKMLFQDEYIILEAESGEECMEVVECCQGHIDIMLLDLIMPDLDGLSILEKRQQFDYFKDIPVVVITSSVDTENQVKAFSLGANDYITKPFVPEIVKSRVDNVMDSHNRVRSITKEAENLKVKAEMDQLTGLYNKVTAQKMITDILVEKCNRLHALIMIDVDNFKSVNDLSGHLAGDHTLKIVADLISSEFRKTDIVGRIGGDEFVVMMVDIPDVDLVRSKVSELIQIMKYKPNLTIPENVSLSIGFASNEYNAMSYQELFSHADEALYDAKEAGKARYHEYGVDPVDLNDDNRPSVLLYARNRNVCSTVNALIPTQIKVTEAISLDELKRLSEKEKNKILFSYIDLSDEKEDSTLWDKLNDVSWIFSKPILAFCQEGNMEQLKMAVMHGVSDVFTTPIHSDTFKRRTMQQIKAAMENE